MAFLHPAQDLGPSIERRPSLPFSLVPDIARGEHMPALPALFDLQQLEVAWESDSRALWTFMRPRGRPCYNTDLLSDFHNWQALIRRSFEDARTGFAIWCLDPDRRAFSASAAT